MFEKILGRMKNLGEKSGELTFLVVVWLEGGREKKLWGPSVFSPDLPKYFLSKIERKLG